MAGADRRPRAAWRAVLLCLTLCGAASGAAAAGRVTVDVTVPTGACSPGGGDPGAGGVYWEETVRWTGNSFTFRLTEDAPGSYPFARFQNEWTVTATLSADHKKLTSLGWSFHNKDTFATTAHCAADECFQEQWLSVQLAGIDRDESVPDLSTYYFRANGAAAVPGVSAYQQRARSALYDLESGSIRHSDCTRPLDPSRPDLFGIDVRVEAFAPPTVDLVAGAIEVTQAVQDLHNSVRLVARKPTYVRLQAYAMAGSHVTTARLHLSNGATLLPINPGGRLRIDRFLGRRRPDGEFLFALPFGVPEGQLTFTAELNPADQPPEIDRSNNTISVTRTFETVPVPNLVVFPVRYGPAGNRREASDLHVTKLLFWLRRAYPIATLHSSWRRIYDAGPRLPTCELVNAWLAAVRLLDLHGLGSVEPTTRYYGMVDDGGGFMEGCARGIPSFVASGPTGDPGRYPKFNWDRDGSYGDWYGAHELAHTWGRFHAEFCDALAGVPYPYPGGWISQDVSGAGAFYGFDIHSRAIYPPQSHDLMTYCANQWVSDFTYEGLMDRLQGEGGPGAGAVRANRADASDRLLVTGSIDPASGDVALQPLFILPDADDLAPRTPGEYAIVLRAATGSELARYPFTPHASHVEAIAADGAAEPATPVLFVEELVPFVAGTTRVDVEGPSGLLRTVAAGATPPQVAITAPRGGESLTAATVPVEWTADDPDGDPLRFMVQYSPDDGATWRVVAQNVTAQRVDVDARDLPGGAPARFRVWASDGIHTALDESAAVTVPNHVPTVAITQPSEPVTLARGQTLVLQADAYDDDTGSLDEEVQWRSSRDGVFATGATTGVSTLGTGLHTVTAAVDDGAGGTAAAAVQVTIVDDLSQLPPVPDALSLGPGWIAFDPLAGAISDAIRVDNQNPERDIAWSATASAPWIALSADSGVTPADLTVALADAGLGAGSYLGTIDFVSPVAPDRIETVVVSLTIAGGGSCVGDCNGNGAVTVDELLRMVNVALGVAEVSSCAAGDPSADGRITIDELLEAVNRALTSCQAVEATVTPTGSAAPPRSATSTRTVAPVTPPPTRTTTPTPPQTLSPTPALTATATAQLPATPTPPVTPTAGTAHYCSGGTQPIDIPDDDVVGIGSAISIVDGSIRINRLKVTVRIEHGWAGDLFVTLARPDAATTVTLVDRPGYPGTAFGCGAPDVECELADDSAVPAENECAVAPPALRGTLQPAEPLALFNGLDLAGVWRLGVADHSPGDSGRLVEWCLDAY